MANVSFQAPTDYSAEAEELARRRRYAEMLQQQGMQTPKGGMAGRFYVAPSWTQGAAGLAQTLLGANEERAVDEKSKQLAQALKSSRNETLGRFGAALEGDPNAAQWDERGQIQAAPRAADPKAALRILAESNDPTLAAQGSQAMLAQALKGSDEKFGHSVQYTKDGRPYLVSDKGAVKWLDPSVTPRDQYSTQTADSVARLAQAQEQWNGLSAKQRLDAQFDAARLGISVQELLLNRARTANQGIETQDSTGQGVIPGMPTLPTIPVIPPAGYQQGAQVGAPAVPQPPQGMPPQAMPQRPAMAPRPAPRPAPVAAPMAGGMGADGAPMPLQPGAPRPVQAAPVGPQGVFTEGLTPKQIRELKLEQAKGNIGGMKDAKSVLNLMNGIEDIIDKAHGSGIGNLVGGAQNMIGIPLGHMDKNAADARLQAISGALIAKMPKMSGPQSDKDVLLYRQMAGDLANPNLPADVRKAAAETVRAIQQTYINGYSETGYQPAGQAATGRIRKYNEKTGVIE